MDQTHFIDREPNKYEALAELHKQDILSMKEDGIQNTVDKWENVWNLKSNDFTDSRNLGYRQYIHHSSFDENGNLDPSKVELHAIKSMRDRCRQYLTNLKNHARDLKMHKKELDESGATIVTKINNILKQVTDGYDNIRRHYISFERVYNPTAQPQFKGLGDPSTMDDEEIENSTPFQKCLLYSLDQTYKAG